MISHTLARVNSLLCIIIAGMNNNPSHLRNLIHQRQIVQQYPPINQQKNPYSPIRQPMNRMFYEQQIFQQLERTAIVEDYVPYNQYYDEHNQKMEQQPQRMDQQPYEELFPNVRKRITFSPKKILDSASSGRELPSRNSSISSLSSYQQKIIHTPLALRQPLKIQETNDAEKTKKIFAQQLRKGGKQRREVGSSTEKRERLNKMKKVQQVGCNCKKSKCLKMYCECFNLQILCTQNCNCVGCGNFNQNQSHQKAVLQALTRNPRAFVEDSQSLPTFNLGVQLSQVRRGCKCRKTKCLKKYCQCYNSGQICGIFCQCQGCFNCQSHNHK